LTASIKKIDKSLTLKSRRLSDILHPMINNIIKTFLILGTIAYGVAFFYSLTSTQSIEKNARSFVKEQISKKTHEKIDNLDSKYKDNKLVKLSAKIFKQKAIQLKLYKEALKSKIDEKLASVMVKMKNFDCECRKKYTKYFNGIITAKIANLESAKKKLEEFMTHKYMFVVENVIKDLRIFLGSSFFVLLLMTGLLLLKPQATTEVNLLAGTMLVSTATSSYLYIFNQNWFYTIIYNDFVGYFYLLYLGIIFLFLCDIIFNKSRVTDVIINGISSAPASVC